MSIIGHGVGHAGTFTNNKPGVAAAYATLRLLQEKPVLRTIRERGTRLMNGLREIFEENGIPVVMSGFPAMFSFALGITEVSCQRDWDKSDRDLYVKLAGMAVERGVMPDVDAREPWFLCYEHTDKDIDDTLQVYADLVKSVKRAFSPS
jgi:glutamate-1-semialdehyde 2,1-aminomutase